MTKPNRKQIAFDLDTDSLSEHYPGSNWTNAYYEIKGFMARNGFQWIQGSVYSSKVGKSIYDIDIIINSMIKEHPWLNFCMRDCRVTSIGRTHNLTYLFGKEEKLPETEIAKVPSMQKKR